MSKMKNIAIDLENELKELKEDKEVIFDEIAELYEYIEEEDFLDKDYILEQLASIQSYAK